MNNENISSFICELRKEKGLTQKQLAEQLNITDKAVSKWERGLGCPDINILCRLAEALGVTTNELLSGSRKEAPEEAAEIIVQNTLHYAQKVTVTRGRKLRTIFEFVITISCVIAIFVCSVCDLAMTGRFTWSLYPTVSIVFGWLVTMPLLHFEKARVTISLLSLSVFVLPFLFYIEQISNTAGWFFPLALPIVAASLLYLWYVLILLKRKHANLWYTSATAVLLAMPLTLFINLICSWFTGGILFRPWDVINTSAFLIMSIFLYAVGFYFKKKS